MTEAVRRPQHHHHNHHHRRSASAGGVVNSPRNSPRSTSAKQSGIRSRIINSQSVFRQRTKNDDNSELSSEIVIGARRTGKLCLASRGLATGIIYYKPSHIIFFLPFKYFIFIHGTSEQFIVACSVHCICFDLF